MLDSDESCTSNLQTRIVYVLAAGAAANQNAADAPDFDSVRTGRISKLFRTGPTKMMESASFSRNLTTNLTTNRNDFDQIWCSW
jgi:hypothetical protein